MRSRTEIAFRLKQELANLWLNAAKPEPRLAAASPLPILPDPLVAVHAVRGTAHATIIEALAGAVLQGNVSILNSTVHTGHEVRWRRDAVNQIESPLRYFRQVPYLDFNAVGEHRLIWELNRHQHLVILAQAYLLTGRVEYVAELTRQIESWLSDNPFMQGINWTSALEVAFRALSWIWIWHFCGTLLPEALRHRFLAGLYRHGLYIEHNLSVYFSPNTHLQGEAVALHALGRAFPHWPRAEAWRRTGLTITQEAMNTQVREDGSQFEQSSFYHLYALDLFLLHAILEETPLSYREKLARMADYLAALMGPGRILPLIGDDDGGRVFHPFGPPDRFGRATLATSAAFLGRDDLPFEPEDTLIQAVWWLGPDACRGKGSVPRNVSRLFPDAGIAILSMKDVHVTVDCGPFGSGSGGHSHSDTLSITVSRGEEEILIDAGTFSYSDPAWRNKFRGSAAHNTVRIAGRDQAVPGSPFRWNLKPDVHIDQWDAGQGIVVATCSYAGFRHTRRVQFSEDALFIDDKIEGPPGDWLIEQFWHPGGTAALDVDGALRIGSQARLVWGKGNTEEILSGGDYGWRSRGFGHKEPATVVRLSRAGSLPMLFTTVLHFNA